MNLNLKLQIVKSGRTQRSIAQQIGMTEDRLSDIVRGHDATATERGALSWALRVDDADLFDSPALNAVEAHGFTAMDVPRVVRALRAIHVSSVRSDTERQAAALLIAAIEDQFRCRPEPEVSDVADHEG